MRDNQRFFNVKNLDLIIYFPYGKEFSSKINSLLKSLNEFGVISVSQDNEKQFICMLLNDFYGILFNLLHYKLDSVSSKLLHDYNESLPKTIKKRTIDKLKKDANSFFKSFPHLKNLLYLSQFTGLYISNMQVSLTGRIKEIQLKEKNKSRAKLKLDSQSSKYYMEVRELNLKGASVYKACKIVAKKADLDPQNFYSAFKGWAKRNKISLNKHK